MRVLCDYQEMKSLGTSLEEDLTILEELKTKTLADIEKIRDYYQGEDADMIIEKYKSKVNRVNNIVYNLTNYKNYFNGISTNVEENKNKGLSALKEKESEIKELKVGDENGRLDY